MSSSTAQQAEFLQLQKLRAQAITVSQELDLPHAPEVLWPLLSNTDLVNAAIGLDPTENSFLPMAQGGTQLQVSMGSGFSRLVYLEYPYEWNAPYHTAVERVVNAGPLKYLRFELHLNPTETGTRVQNQLHFVSRLPGFVVKKRLQSQLKKMLDVYQAVAQRISAGKNHPAWGFAKAVAEPEALAELCSQWQQLMPDSAVPAALARHLYTAPERFVYRMRPFELAELYDLDPEETLLFCLWAVKAGFLGYRWDLRCPGCKGPKATTPDLQAMVTQAHCPACAVQYEVGFDQNLEMTFYPSPELLNVQELDFCAGSPANTPHVPVQINLWPLSQVESALLLPVGEYALHSLLSARPLCLFVAEGGLESLELTLDEGFSALEAQVLAPACVLRVHNPKNYLQTLKIEDLDWQAQGVTAALVNSLQEFQNLFSTEKLPPELTLTICQQVFLSFELQGAAAEEMPQYLELIQSQVHGHRGAMVSSAAQGLATFQSSLDALDAALESLQQLAELNQMGLSEEPLCLSLALHQGPCEVGSQAGETFYRGETLLELAELLSHSKGQDLVLSSSVFQDSEFKYYLLENQLKLMRLPPQAEDQAPRYRVVPQLLAGSGVR